MGQDIVGGDDVGQAALGAKVARQLGPEEAGQGRHAARPRRLGAIVRRIDPLHGNAGGLEILQEIAVVGGDLDHQAVRTEGEALGHHLGIGAGVRQPGGRKGGEVGVVAVEMLLAAGDVLDLHQLADAADEGAQREEALGVARLFGRAHGVGNRRHAEVDEQDR